MYTLATRFCNQIYLYGFWPFPLDQNQNPVKYHYYDSLKYGYTSQASPHTMPLEFKALKSLHEQGALKLTVGQCDGATLRKDSLNQSKEAQFMEERLGEFRWAKKYKETKHQRSQQS
ncbi:hypothetical protein A6R68_01289 [Neotoma lepida]|uniref:Uncharacterized protein n=1 Tax=Neotoma lepida TaxID=56216 RepID=A0A1A6GW38_NEOLE|nr:hypothetical protein A6R68_01289 [Neotoma lepida]